MEVSFRNKNQRQNASSKISERNENQIQIALVAACDRNNYGDVLLPLLVERFYKMHGTGTGEVIFHYFALSSADLSEIGGKAVNALNEITEEYKFVIVAGGEVLTAQYFNMFLNLQTNKIIIAITMKMMGRFQKVLNFICKWLLHGKESMPWIVYPIMKGQKIYYNAVGGAGLSLNMISDRQVNDWIKVSFLSEKFTVRDKKTYDYFIQHGADKVRLLPDTAIIMSRLYKTSELEKYNISVGKEYINNMGAYWVLQINDRFSKGLIDNLVSGIDEIYEKSGFKCVLLPIGRAAGHDDVIPLGEIYTRCNKNAVAMIHNNNIYDVMYIIARSRCFVGSSLHGVITAASYRIPHTVVTSRAEKTLAFVDTWNTTRNRVVDSCEELMEFVNCPYIDKSVNGDSIEQMINAVDEYFQEIVYNIDQESAR